MSKLCISRRVDESFFIFVDNKEIEIRVNNIRGNQVSLSIDAPKEFEVLREELLEYNED